MANSLRTFANKEFQDSDEPCNHCKVRLTDWLLTLSARFNTTGMKNASATTRFSSFS